MGLLEKSAKIILEYCMSLKTNESCLIITDSKLKSIGNVLYKNSLKIAKKSKLILTTIPKSHGAEPPKYVADEMLNYDVILMPTTKSLSHTKARENASKNGATALKRIRQIAIKADRRRRIIYFQISTLYSQTES